MRLFILTLLFCISYSGYSQEWVEVEVSDDVTVSMPEGYSKLKEKGKISFWEGDNRISFIIEASKLKTVYPKKDSVWSIKDSILLIKHYKKMTRESSKALNPDEINKKIFDYKDLLCLRFDYRGLAEGFVRLDGSEKTYALLFLLRKKVYALRIEASGTISSELNKNIDRFFSSIKFREGLTNEDQFTK